MEAKINQCLDCTEPFATVEIIPKSNKDFAQLENLLNHGARISKKREATGKLSYMIQVMELK